MLNLKSSMTNCHVFCAKLLPTYAKFNGNTLSSVELMVYIHREAMGFITLKNHAFHRSTIFTSPSFELPCPHKMLNSCGVCAWVYVSANFNNNAKRISMHECTGSYLLAKSWMILQWWLIFTALNFHLKRSSKSWRFWTPLAAIGCGGLPKLCCKWISTPVT